MHDAAGLVTVKLFPGVVGAKRRGEPKRADRQAGRETGSLSICKTELFVCWRNYARNVKSEMDCPNAAPNDVQIIKKEKRKE